MQIIIDTNGNSLDTEIALNGRRVDKLLEFHLSVHTGKKVKLQMVKEINGQKEFISYYGDDFKKFDECNPVKSVEKGELK